MTQENGKMTSECAVHFEKLDGEIRRVQQDRAASIASSEATARTIREIAATAQANHEETTRLVTNFQGQMIEMISKQSERTALCEASTSSAHHRIDTMEAGRSQDRKELRQSIGETKKLLWALLVLGLTLTAGGLLTFISNASAAAGG
jgi:septal ring factor EnvC (AmiA/AmiB activator)